MDDATLTSPDAAAMDHRITEQLLMIMVVHSLLRKDKEERANDDDDGRELKDMVREFSMAINSSGDDQSAVSKELLLAVTQQMLDVQLRSLDEGEQGRVEVSSSVSEHQLTDSAAAAKKTDIAAAKKKKKMRNKRNKAAAKHKGRKRMSWLGGGIISLLMMAAAFFGSLSLIHQSDGSSGEGSPTLPPSASTSLRQRDIQSSSDMASTSPIIISPLAVVVQPPIFSPAAVSNPPMNSVDERALLSACFDTPNWEDLFGRGCKWYEEDDLPGCPYYGSVCEGNMGVANDNCCYCGKEPCTDTPNWNDGVHDCTWYEENDSQGCPKYGGLFGEKVMGLAKDHCCYCKRAVVALVTPSAPPSISTSPTVSLSPSSSICTDATGWYDEEGYDCVWYEVMDDPGCPQYGGKRAGTKGPAKDNCCYCKNDIVNTLSPTVDPSSSGTCVDTLEWEDDYGRGCEAYQENDDPGCPNYGDYNVGDMGPAADNCCYCKDSTCEDFQWKCQTMNDRRYWEFVPDRVKSVCDEAVSCSCEADDSVKIVNNLLGNGYNETVGLYNECKCDFWSVKCDDARGGVACDYAAEYCCGDYRYRHTDDDEIFWYQNSDLCYCDFFNYAWNDFGHTLKPKALNINRVFSNPCGYFEDRVSALQLLGLKVLLLRSLFERLSLEAIYNATNGQNWKNGDGWMNETVDHCQWYGISCDDEGFVTSIDLRNNNLTGNFPVYTRNEDPSNDGKPILGNIWIFCKYGLANLFRLKTLDLANNKLTGAIEYAPLYNLNALTHFDVSGNQLSGEIDALVAPSLTHADFSSNSFTSMRPFHKYKVSPLQTLRYCDVSNNAIREDATDLLQILPPNIEQFTASHNNISGVLPDSLNNLRKLRQCNMASNALSGKLPQFTESFATLQALDLSNQTNGFTGPIPEDIWRSLSLKILNLAGNRLTGTIPSLVGNLAVLEVFDLSNNLLNSSLPPELGMLEGSLKRLDLSYNTLFGRIPSQIGQLQGASVFLKGNRFSNSSTTAPLSLCLEREVEGFDLADDIMLCPMERNALSAFYDSAKGAEWTDQGSKTDGSLWLDEYASCCNWKGITCDDEKNHVIELNLTNNGLSGRLSESIGILEFVEVLDLGDNDIKGSIPTELGKLRNLKKLRLSYNAFTGAAPEGLGGMKGLELLQLQSNRITEMPNITRLNDIYGKSAFVTDCGVPSAFDEALKCEHCTMCCNANDDCYPQEATQVATWGLNYGTFAAVLFAGTCFFVLLIWRRVALFLDYVDNRKNRGNISTKSMETKIKEDDKYAMSKIGKDSVYSYFVTDKALGWLAAFVTIGIQIGILVFFIMASEANLQDDTIDIQFSWKCPRDTYVCTDKADLTDAGWVIFSVLMVASVAKDFIGGIKLIYHSAKVRHSIKSRIRYFFGGMSLCWITLFALYVSTIYNKAIATSNTEIIVNSVIILFVMDLDEWIFSALTAWNKKWTAHAEDGTIDEMKEELRKLREIVQSMQESQVQYIYKSHKFRGNRSRLNRARMLREIEQKRPESQVAATTPTTSDSDSECEGDTNAR